MGAPFQASRRTFLATAALLAGTRSAVAQPRTVRTTGFNHRRGWLTVSVGVQDLLHGLPANRLTSGVATRVLVRALLLREAPAAPVGAVSRHTEIVWDVWDERF